jgi:hypothetical protein
LHISGDENIALAFEELYSLMNGRPMYLNQANCSALEDLCHLLDCPDILEVIHNFQYTPKELSVSNCVSRIQAKWKSKSVTEEELEFIAINFHSINEESLKVLPCEILEAIVSHPKISLKDEDVFVDFIESLGEEYFSLYGYVNCLYLTSAGMVKFLSSVSNENVTVNIWNSLCSRLTCEVKKPNFESCGSRVNRVEFTYDRKKPFDGIIAHLTKLYGGNVHANKVVRISAKGTTDEYYGPWNVANLKDRSYWVSEDLKNSWICFDFRERRISVKDYVMKSHQGPSFPESWVVEGRNDVKCDWTVIDERRTQDLVGANRVASFECGENRGSGGFFRFIRFRQTGMSSDHDHYFVLEAIELYGSLSDNDSKAK